MRTSVPAFRVETLPGRLAGRGLGSVAKMLARRHSFVVPRSGFDLTAVRTGPRGQTPVLFVPGGPGMASVVPYARLRSLAAKQGLDVIMVEHRGVGLSRRSFDETDLPRAEVTIEAAADDLAAVLDTTHVPQVVVYGSSYGSYLAQAFAALHPDRVAAMVLDSPLLSIEDDLKMARGYQRQLLWDGPGELASAVRETASSGVAMDELTHVVEVVYEFAGPEVLLRLLRARRQGRIWQQVSRQGAGQLEGRGVPYVMEPDLVSGIGFGELGFGLPPDGLPLDPKLHFADAATRQPAYHGEPFDLPIHLGEFPRPLVVVSGERDLRTPRPIAERAVSLAPQAVLVPMKGMGHSAMDTHQLAAVQIAQAAVLGTTAELPARRLSELPRRGASYWLGPVLKALI